MKLIKIETEKTSRQVIEEIKKKASEFDFTIREVFDMAKEFREHSVEVKNNFEYYSIMLCNPQKAYESISKKPIRGALLLPPKQVVIFKENGKTIISYVAIEKEDVKELFSEDGQFQESLSQSCDKIKELVNSINENGGI